MTAAVKVVELGLGHRVVDVEGGNQKLGLLLQFVEAMHARGGLLRDAFPLLDQFVKDKGIFGVNLLEEILDDFFLVAGAGGVDPVIAFLEFIAFVKEEGHVAAVIDD